MNGNIFGTSPAPSQQPSVPVSAQQMQQVRQMLNTLNPNQSPQQMLQALASQNPQFGNLLTLMNGMNGDIQALVTNLAKQKGVDLNALYEQYKAL